MQDYTKAMKHIELAQSYAFGGNRRREKASKYIEATLESIREISEKTNYNRHRVTRQALPFRFHVYGLNTNRSEIEENNYVPTNAIVTIASNQYSALNAYQPDYHSVITFWKPGMPQAEEWSWRTGLGIMEKCALSWDEKDRDAKIHALLDMALDHIRVDLKNTVDDTIFLKEYSRTEH